MLFPYSKLPDTDSQIPATSTGGATMITIINMIIVSIRRVGIIIPQNHPMYRQFSVLVIQLQNFARKAVDSQGSRIAVRII